METKTDQSYGVIPIRRADDTWEVLLIHQFNQSGDSSYWILPKGHAEVGETPLRAATRELKEETGLVAAQLLSQPTFDLHYSFIHSGTKVNKTVTFFIGVIEESALKLDMREVREAVWCPLKDATERLDYDDTREMFRSAQRYIGSMEV